MDGEQEMRRDIARGMPAPLFLLSFRQRGELAALVVDAGWRVVAARRGDGAARRFEASGAALALIDARGALDEGLAAVAAVAPVASARGAALLALISRVDLDSIGRFYEAGATHFLASPFTEGELVQALRFAGRHAERMAGGWIEEGPGVVGLLGWRLDLKDRSIQVTGSLARLLGTAERIPMPAALRRLGVDRALAVDAVRRLAHKGGATAFAHDLPGLGRVVHHMQADWDGSVVHGLIEALGDAPDAVAEMGDEWGPTRGPEGARGWLQRRLDAGEGPTTLLVGLSRLDLIGSAYGPLVAQSLVQAAGRRVTRAARRVLGKRALVSSAGPARFLVATLEERGVEQTAARLAEVLVRPFALNGALVTVGARVGIAHARQGDTAATLLARAGDALSQAQTIEGGQVYRARHPGVGEPSTELLSADLGRAIEAGEIALLYQPQVAIGSGAIVGVEALARWEHPRFGEVGAVALFAAADHADLGIALSDHIQRRALTAAARWTGPLARLRLAINLNAADIARPDFADLFLDRVDSASFPRARLTVEITESGLIADLSAAASLLTALRAAGCRAAIDDFGTGYSSLAYLKALPLDYLKIDKGLAQDITGSPRDRVVVRGVIDMARSLGLAVIAEGVETSEQLELLAKEGCNFYQGFLCAGPLTETALAALVER